MLIYQIKLPAEQDADAFATFMRETYFPAIHRGATRIGQIINLILLQGTNGNLANDFFLHLDWNGLTGEDIIMMIRIEDDDINQKFRSFGGRIENLGTYEKVASLDNA